MRRSFSRVFVAVLCTVLLSCGKDSDVEDLRQCTIEGIFSIEPICAFNPRQLTTVPFPVKVVTNGTDAGTETYEFSWSSNADFKGSAISVDYEGLPLTVTLIEKSTGCTAEATLEKDYWD